MSRHKSEQSLRYKPEECTWVLRPPGKSSSGIYRLSRFSASSEAGKAKQLQAGLRVHIRTTRLRELQCSRSLARSLARWWRWMHIHVLLPGSGSWGWEPHWRGWEPAWWQSSGAKLVSRWISQWWKMKCTQPSETNRQAERWAQSCQCRTFHKTHTHSHSHKHINTLELPCTHTFSLSLFTTTHTHSLN